MIWTRFPCLLALSLFAVSLGRVATAGEPAAVRVAAIEVEPAAVRLVGANDLRGLLVHGVRGDGRRLDFTAQSRYASRDPRVARVDRSGVVYVVGNGRTVISVNWDGQAAEVPVEVTDATHVRSPHFENDVVPIFSKYGCNSSGCHGKAEGQNGFKLSVFGFDPAADYNALTKEARGRRVFPAAADQSLLLTKMSGRVPHGGGIRLAEASREYEVIRRWIAAGTPRGRSDAAKVARIRVAPGTRVLDPGARQQLRVVAEYTDGRLLDVTQIAKYQSNNEGLGTVDEQGLITIGSTPGQVAVMAGFAGAVATFEALIPQPPLAESFPQVKEHNFIDPLVHAKLKKLNIVPSQPADDGEFLRRVYLDLIGVLPTAAEARRFLGDAGIDKRRRLVDELLERPEYADLWSLRMADLLRVDRRALGHERARDYHRWIRQRVAANQPYDGFVRDILTLKGNLRDAPQSAFYSVVGGAGPLASTTSQVFLGVRIACAQCHHHPFDRWSQTDYYGMTAFFAQVKRKGTPRGEVLTATGNPVTKHPRSGAVVLPHALGTKPPDDAPDGDRREVLASWMTAADNPWFARNAVNRVWAHLMGRGLVEPVDDFRDTNPPTNPELLDALARHYVEAGFDTKQLLRTIVASAAYQRSSKPNATNRADEQNYSRALLKRLDAEVLLDALCQVTGRDEKFRGVPFGSRATQLWDSEVDHYFLKLFGRPARKTACSCERNAEPTVGQVLHLLNSPQIERKLAHEAGRVARLARAYSDDEPLVEELYLTFFARRPTAAEQKRAVAYFKNTDGGRRDAAEDLAWSLMNSLEFIFNH